MDGQANPSRLSRLFAAARHRHLAQLIIRSRGRPSPAHARVGANRRPSARARRHGSDAVHCAAGRRVPQAQRGHAPRLHADVRRARPRLFSWGPCIRHRRRICRGVGESGGRGGIAADLVFRDCLALIATTSPLALQLSALSNQLRLSGLERSGRTNTAVQETGQRQTPAGPVLLQFAAASLRKVTVSPSTTHSSTRGRMFPIRSAWRTPSRCEAVRSRN